MRKRRLTAEYPEAVINRFDKLRGELPFPITLFRSGNHYYVVKQEYYRDQTGKLKRSKVEYLGRITDEGVFKFKNTGTESEVEVARAILRDYGENYRININRQSDDTIRGLTDVDRQALTNLTMNARMPPIMLASNLGVPKDEAVSIRTSLRRKLSLSFIPDIRLTKIGFIEFAIFVKFLGKQPNPELVKIDLENSGWVQFAAFTSGEYDMIMFIVAESDEKLADVVKNIKGLQSFSSLDSRWYISYFHKTKSFVPLRPKAMEILKGRVWRRKRGSTKPESNQLLESEFNVLKCLTENGAMKFSNMEAKYNMSNGSARYAYDRLIRREILPRVTISINNAGVKSIGIIIMEIINDKAFQESRKKLIELIMEESAYHTINRFALVGDITNPEGVIFFIPMITGKELDDAISELNIKVNGITTSKIMITSIVVGRIPSRRIDPYYTSQWSALVSKYNAKPVSPIIYDEETFYKLKKIGKHNDED